MFGGSHCRGKIRRCLTMVVSAVTLQVATVFTTVRSATRVMSIDVIIDCIRFTVVASRAHNIDRY